MIICDDCWAKYEKIIPAQSVSIFLNIPGKGAFSVNKDLCVAHYEEAKIRL